MKIHFSNSFFGLFIASFVFLGCQKDPNNVRSYLSDKERDTLLTNVITYTSQYARGASNATRFAPQFRQEYISRLGQYRFENYYVAPDSTHYFFVSRPVGGGYFRRGVGGKFKMGKNLMPVEYEEMWCTPHFKTDSLVQERGGFLFKAMIKQGNIDKYRSMKLYVEWPDTTLVYDKKTCEWVATEKARR